MHLIAPGEPAHEFGRSARLPVPRRSTARQRGAAPGSAKSPWRSHARSRARPALCPCHVRRRSCHGGHLCHRCNRQGQSRLGGGPLRRRPGGPRSRRHRAGHHGGAGRRDRLQPDAQAHEARGVGVARRPRHLVAGRRRGHRRARLHHRPRWSIGRPQGDAERQSKGRDDAPRRGAGRGQGHRGGDRVGPESSPRGAENAPVEKPEAATTARPGVLFRGIPWPARQRAARNGRPSRGAPRGCPLPERCHPPRRRSGRPSEPSGNGATRGARCGPW